MANNIDLQVDDTLERCILSNPRKSFFLFAGAGSGKTYSLVLLLKKIRDSIGNDLLLQGKNVAVIGGGNTALYDALYLSDIVSKVYLVHRRNEFRGDKVLVDKLKQKENVEFVTPFVPEEFLGDDKLTCVKVKMVDSDEVRAGDKYRFLEVDGVFVAVGKKPMTEKFAELVELDDGGYILAGEDCVTSCPGVFVAGDCRTKAVRQLVTAAGDAAVAAEAVINYLD